MRHQRTGINHAVCVEGHFADAEADDCNDPDACVDGTADRLERCEGDGEAGTARAISCIHGFEVTGECRPYCESDASCPVESGQCDDALGICRPATCDDHRQNGDESRVDCGGGCPACPAADSDTTCDGIDDDRDGRTDEHFDGGGVLCDPACRRRVEQCLGGSVHRVCEVEADQPLGPPAESCNGRDDDCDGSVDESFNLGELCKEGVGVCAVEGIVACSEAGDAVCDTSAEDPLVEPSEEVCDGLDNDCDGSIDETFPQRGQSCDGGQGACARVGEMICTEEGVHCNVIVGDPVVEVCNGIDDDCDGVIDDGVANACGGCGPEPIEVCNGEDDDCDGQVDEDFDLDGDPQHCGACGETCVFANATPNCIGGECGSTCLPGWWDPDGDMHCDRACLDEERECDGLDEDCDGEIDEGHRNDCGRCVAFNQEFCNELDDDCDGEVDEEHHGACTNNCRSVELCSNGERLMGYQTCEPPFQPLGRCAVEAE